MVKLSKTETYKGIEVKYWKDKSNFYPTIEDQRLHNFTYKRRIEAEVYVKKVIDQIGKKGVKNWLRWSNEERKKFNSNEL